jgi:Flp pilus assembly protein TadG
MSMMKLPSPRTGAQSRKRRQSGSVLVEVTLLLPWYLFLFVGAVDWGFYSHALISVEAATRTAAMFAAQKASAPSVATVCPYVLGELAIAANVGSTLDCTTAPVVVTIATLSSTSTPVSPDGGTAYSVSVRYSTVQLIPIPGLLAGKTTFTRTVVVKPSV